MHSQLSDNLKTRCRWVGTLVRPTEKARAGVGRPDGWEVVLLDLGRCCCSGWRQSVDLSNIVSLTLNGIVADETNYKEGLKSIHTSCVQATIDNQTNKILNAAPPKIDDSERNLPRKTRTTLSQLRSGYSPFLQSYLSRIMPDEHQDLCPKCQASPHTTTHLFACPADPTDLTVKDLWHNPQTVASFLGLPTSQDPGDLDDND